MKYINITFCLKPPKTFRNFSEFVCQAKPNTYKADDSQSLQDSLLILNKNVEEKYSNSSEDLRQGKLYSGIVLRY